MNARTIQHPGIEIREIDLTEYKDTVTTNNAYVIGFTDRGPIYDYSWITTRSEFINLYGEPQTEAEKYLYYAVQSILNNGGTPIVARMPYDNKQCKAYKALKIKYASVAEDENSETGFTLYDWATNDTQFSSNASALISLDRVGSYINPDGFETVLETLNNQHVTIAKNPATGTGEPETIVNPAELTYNNLLLSLNSDIAFEADLKDDPTMENITSGLQLINKSIGFANQTGHFDQDTNDDGINDAISVNYVCENSFTSGRVNGISECANNVSAEFEDVFGGIPDNLKQTLSGEIKTLSEFNDYFELPFASASITLTMDNVSGSVKYPESTKISIVSGKNSEPIIELGSVPGVISGIQATTNAAANKQFVTVNVTGNIVEVTGTSGVLIENTFVIDSETSGKFTLSGIVSGDLTSISNLLSGYVEQTIVERPLTPVDNITRTFSTDAVSGVYEIISKDEEKTVLIPLKDLRNYIANFADKNPDQRFDKGMSIIDILFNSSDFLKRFYGFAGATSIPNDFGLTMIAAGKFIKKPLPTSGVTLKINDSITGEFTLSELFTDIKDRFNAANNAYRQIKYDCIYGGAEFGEQNVSELYATLETFDKYLDADTTGHKRDIAGFCSVFSGNLQDIWKSASGIISETFKLPATSVEDLLSKYAGSDSAMMNDSITCPTSGIFENVEETINKYPVLYNIYPTGRPRDWFMVLKEAITLDAIKDKITAQGNYIKVNGKRPADLGIPLEVIEKYLPGGTLNASVKDCLSGNLYTADKLSGETLSIQRFDKALAQIFNDPFFKKLDGTEAGQAIVDAHLLTTPELSYEYGVFLDSAECEISNEQYDDLVTTNNFTKKSMESKYGSNIDNANFVIVDKQKTIVDGIGSNQGYFVTLIDPYDALKMQRMLVNPCQAKVEDTNVNNSGKTELPYYGGVSDYAWKKLFKTEINNLNTLQRIKNADGMWIGEPNPGNKAQLLDSWSVPLMGDYYNQSISKDLMGLFPQIPLTDVASNAGNENALCTIDKQYSSYIVVAVCKTTINPSDGKITVAILEQFFGSLFDEKDVQSGRDLYIGNIINANSNYIEFYRNTYLKPAFGAGTEPPEFKKTPVPQFYIKDSAALNNAAKMVGIDISDERYADDNEEELLKDLRASNIFIFDKKRTIFYNNHPQAILTSFSKKEAQKVIANTTGLFGQEYGTTANIGDNFITDMDRCVSFIKNIDDIPIYFIADAGLSTIAQFCDNVVWDAEANNGAGKWVTQNFDPDNDPDVEDRVITQYTDVATWRKVIDKLDQVSREIRKDCMTIIDAPRQLTLDGAAPKIRRSKPQNNWDDVVGDKLRFISGINSSYSAGYYNWLRTTDEFSGNAIWLPPTCKIIGNYMYLNAVNLPWLAPAGLSYGVITGIHGISHNPSPAEEDQIYLKSWNYVKQYPFDGFIIEGQKTTLTKNSAFNRVNVRTLFLDLERYVYNVARTFKYTVNNQYTREQFVQTIKPKFEDYMIRHGLYDYRIVCNDTNNTPESIDRNELRVAIYLKPARLVEFIMIDFIAAKTGANFDEIVL